MLLPATAMYAVGSEESAREEMRRETDYSGSGYQKVEDLK